MDVVVITMYVEYAVVPVLYMNVVVGRCMIPTIIHQMVTIVRMVMSVLLVTVMETVAAQCAYRQNRTYYNFTANNP